MLPTSQEWRRSGRKTLGVRDAVLRKTDTVTMVRAGHLTRDPVRDLYWASGTWGPAGVYCARCQRRRPRSL